MTPASPPLRYYSFHLSIMELVLNTYHVHGTTRANLVGRKRARNLMFATSFFFFSDHKSKVGSLTNVCKIQKSTENKRNDLYLHPSKDSILLVCTPVWKCL